MFSGLDSPVRYVTVTMILLRLDSAWSRLSGRFTQKLSTIVISAREAVDKPLSLRSKDNFRLVRDPLKYCPPEISQAPCPDLATTIDSKPLQTRRQLISILAVHIAVIYGTVTRDAVISTLYIVVFAHLSGTTSQIKRVMFKSSLWLIRKTRMRTGRRTSNQYSSKGPSKMDGRSQPSLAMSPPHTGKSPDSSQTTSYRHSIPRMYLKSQMIPLFLSFSASMKVSKAAPITSRAEAMPCHFTTGDPSSDCPIGTSTSLTPGAQALIASCVLAALLVILIVVFGLPQAVKNMALVIWVAHLPGFNREVFRWHFGRDHAGLEERVVQNSPTVEATEGITGNDMLASENTQGRFHWKPFTSWFPLFRMPQLLKSEGQDQGDERNVRTSDVPAEQDEAILGMGSIFESETMERSLEFHDLDLIHSSQDEGHELEELPAASLGPSDRQDQS